MHTTQFHPAEPHAAAPNGSTRTAGTSVAAPLYVPRLARETEPCANCGALLASDQRYCLSCGERRAQVRVPLPRLEGSSPLRSPTAAAPAPNAAPAAPAPPAPPRRVVRRGPGGLPDWALSALFGLAGAAALALGILAGVLIAGGGDDTPAAVAAATPTPVVTAAPSATAAAPVATPTPAVTVEATFTADWQPGQNGWTVQLKTLPKDGTTPDAITAAKSEATGQGAAEVGALDADAFASLGGGTYVIYSGVHTTKKDADDALAGIQANFPDATVVEVSDQAPGSDAGSSSGGGGDPAVTKSKDDLKSQEETQSPEDAQKNTRKAPPKVKSEGTPPPADDKAPGGDSGAPTEIG